MTQVTRLGRAGSVTLSKGLGHDQTEVDGGGDVTPPVDQVPVTGAAIETRVADVGSVGTPTLVNDGFQDNALGLVTVTMSGTISAGSLLLAWLCKRDAIDIDTPTGWSLIEPIVGADGHGGAAFLRIADGTEGTTVAMTGGSGSHRKSLYVQEWTGVNTIDVSDRLSEQASATTHTLPSVTPTAGLPAAIVGMFVKDAQALDYTAGSGYTEDNDANVGSAAQPRGLVEHKIVNPTTGSYAPDSTQATSRPWGGVVAVLVGDPGVETWEPAPEVGDENDTSYHVTDQDDFNLRADLGTSLLIARATLLVSTLAAGSRTFYLYGSNDPDFDTETLLDSQAFTSAGSYDPQTLTFQWTATTAYRYYRVRVSDADTYRYYTLSMYLASATTDGECCDKSRTIEESGSAVTLDFRVANWWDVTLSDDCTVSVIGAPTPPGVGELNAVWRQPAAGGPFTITYGAEVLIPDTDGTDGGTPPTLHTAAGAEDVHKLTALDGETWGLSYDSASSGSTPSGDVDAIDVGYDNTESLLEAENVQDAIDELADAIGWDVTVGSLTAGGSPATVVDDTSYNAFPGAVWIDDTREVGSRILAVWRKGTDHASTNDGVIRAAILTITNATTWAYSVGTAFTIYDHVTLDVRVEHGIARIGTALYISGRLYDGSDNQLPFVLKCDSSVSGFTSGSTWTKHDITMSQGSVQNYTQGHLLLLDDGTYGQPVGWQSGGTHSVGIAIVTDPTDWSAPTFHTIGSGANDYAEIDIEIEPDGSLTAHINSITNTDHYRATSSDDGATWTSPASIYDGIGWPTFHRWRSGIRLAIYRSNAGSQDAAWRQDVTGADTAYGSETILDSTGTQMEYAAVLQIDSTHALALYGVQTGGTNANIVSQVFTDSSTFGADFPEPDAAAHIADTTDAHDASAISIVDAGSYYTGTQVEAALQEVGAALAAIVPSTGGGSGDHEHIIDVFNGDAATTAFEITNEPLDPEAVFAFVGGSWTAVTVSGLMNTTVTFGSAPGSGTGNVVIQYPAVAA